MPAAGLNFRRYGIPAQYRVGKGRHIDIQIATTQPDERINNRMTGKTYFMHPGGCHLV